MSESRKEKRSAANHVKLMQANCERHENNKSHDTGSQKQAKDIQRVM